MCFTIFQDEIKTRNSKNRKIKIFPNGLTNGFGPKINIFANFYFQLIKTRKMCFTIFQNGKTTSSLKKQRGSKSRKMAIFGPKPWVNPFGKMSIFRLFELLVFISLERSFFALEYHKIHFPGLYCLKKKVEKMATFGPKPWVNPLKRMSIYRLSKLLVFIDQKGVFFRFRISSKTFSWPILQKKKTGKMAIFGPKSCVNLF